MYGHTRELVAEQVTVAGPALLADPVAHRLFVEALLDPRDKRQPSALEIMHQLGILDAPLAPSDLRRSSGRSRPHVADERQVERFGPAVDQGPHRREDRVALGRG